MAVKQKEAPAKKSTNQGTLFVFSGAPEAKSAFVVGEFNDWDQESHRMVKRHGAFQRKIQLKPGEYQYKYLIDGEWHTDPDAEQVHNEFGTMNNIVRVNR